MYISYKMKRRFGIFAKVNWHDVLQIVKIQVLIWFFFKSIISPINSIIQYFILHSIVQVDGSLVSNHLIIQNG